jgi:hypothetical protein
MDTVSIDRLNGLLRDELAAIETYDEALRGRSAFSGKSELSYCQRSHERRAAVLRDKIASLGGQPATSSGLRGAWERLVEASATAVSDTLAIRALEAGEVRVMRDYRMGVAGLAPEVRSFVERSLVPEEEFTLRTMSDLGRRVGS